MTPNEYQKLALRTEKTPLFVNDNEGNPSLVLSRLMHAFIGMCTEAGEAQDMVKKRVIYGRTFEVQNVLEECGDTLWYVALALDAVGHTMEEAMSANIAKLKARYGEKFSEEKALNRDLEAEKKALNGE